MNKITVTYLDGTVEEDETGDQLSVNGMMLVIPELGGSHVAINLTQVRKWEVKVSKLAVASPIHLPPGRA